LNYDVIYGDTDSMMINPKRENLLDVVKVGNEIIKEINKKYKSLQLGLDGVF
jgi:DNA polymerase alpha subunit A